MAQDTNTPRMLLACCNMLYVTLTYYPLSTQVVRIDQPESPQMQELVHLFLKHGAHPNDLVPDCDASNADRRANRDTMTALHSACVEAHFSGRGRGPGAYTVVRLLMEAGGDPNIPSASTHSTALQYAWRKKDTQLLDLLNPGWRSEEAQPASPAHSKAPSRKRRSTPMEVRAERAGVRDKLKPVPLLPGEGASAAEVQQYKHAIQRLQTANQQMVARAEAKLAKRSE